MHGVPTLAQVALFEKGITFWIKNQSLAIMWDKEQNDVRSTLSVTLDQQYRQHNANFGRTNGCMLSGNPEMNIPDIAVFPIG